VRHAYLALTPLLLLHGCGGTESASPAPPTDATLQRDERAGRLAYDLENVDEAVAEYRAALARAQERDDLKAIGDLGYNLSVAELRANMPDRALADARATIAELKRRESTPFPALLLAEATALYRTGSLSEADAAAARIQDSTDRDAAARATFLRGLIADARGDEPGLTAATESLKSASTPSIEADAAELAARLALRHSDFASARGEAARAAALRQDTFDYRGLARVLAIEGEAAARAGDSGAAADLYLRAGRSAAAQGDKTSARPWLQQASTLAPGEPVGVAADELLHSLNEGVR